MDTAHRANNHDRETLHSRAARSGVVLSVSAQVQQEQQQEQQALRAQRSLEVDTG
jgi:hypothetical protein